MRPQERSARYALFDHNNIARAAQTQESVTLLDNRDLPFCKLPIPVLHSEALIAVLSPTDDNHTNQTIRGGCPRRPQAAIARREKNAGDQCPEKKNGLLFSMRTLVAPSHRRVADFGSSENFATLLLTTSAFTWYGMDGVHPQRKYAKILMFQKAFRVPIS